MPWTIQQNLTNRTKPWPPLVSGRFYTSFGIVNTGTGALVAGTLYAIPLVIPDVVTAASLNIEVTGSAAGKSVRMGIYADNSGVPSSLVIDGGAVSVATTGTKTVAISQLLPANWYWLALVSDGTPTVRQIFQGQAIGHLGFTSGTDTTYHVGYSVAFAYAALPNPFTGGGALMSGSAPRIMLGI